MEPDPAVVVDRQREDERRCDLDTDERAEDGVWPLEQKVDRSPTPAGGFCRASGYRHPRLPSDTT